MGHTLELYSTFTLLTAHSLLIRMVHLAEVDSHTLHLYHNYLSDSQLLGRWYDVCELFAVLYYR